MTALPFYTTKLSWPADEGQPEPIVTPPIAEGSVVDVIDPFTRKPARFMLAVEAVDHTNQQVLVDARDEGKHWVPITAVRHAIVAI